MRRQMFLASLFVFSAVVGAGTAALTATQQDSLPATSAGEIITLQIDGWTCASCEKGIRRALEAVPGVSRVDVSYARGGAVVEVEPSRVTGEQLVQAVARAGNLLSSYHATVVPNGTLRAGAEHEGGTANWFRKLFQ